MLKIINLLSVRYEREHADYITSLPPGKHSTKGIGRTVPDPSGDHVTESGAVIPMGKGSSSSSQGTSLLYNESVINTHIKLCTPDTTPLIQYYSWHHLICSAFIFS